MAEDIKVGSYSDLDEGSKTASNYSSSLSELISQASSEMSQLNNESVFMGPACDQCVSAFSAIQSSLSSSVDDFQTISTNVKKAEENYEQEDQAATKEVEEVKT